MNDLTGRVAVVTGGASGIGRACAVALARSGAHVFVGDLDQLPENEPLFGELKVESRRCDVRSESDVEQLMSAAAELGRLDVLVCCAGVELAKQIPEVTSQEWDRCLDTNLKGAFLCCKHAVIPMRAVGGGSIIHVSSNAGILPRAHDPVYSISKGALIALTKSLALCHSSDRIRVNVVCPGPVGGTRMMDADLNAADDPASRRQQLIRASPLASAHDRMIDPVEVAAAVLYLASDASLMVTGTVLAIDGGKSLGVPPPRLNR